MRKLAGVLAALLVPAFSVSVLIATPAFGQDKMGKKMEKAVKEGAVKVVVENEKVKVTEVTYRPGEGSSSRERPARVTHAISGGTMMRILPDGKTENRVWKTGETKYFPQETFANKNVGKTTVKFLVVQPK